MQIDWSTLALQTINVLILVWILARFLFRPLRAIIAQRQAKADALLAEAAAAKQEAVDAKTSAERVRKDIEAQREQLLADAQKEATIETARLLDEAQKDIARLRAEAAAASVRERSAMEAALIAHIKALAIEIARRLVGRIAPDAGLHAFVAGLCAQFERLPPQSRAGFTAENEKSEPVEVVTATALSAEATAYLREKLESILGKGTPFALRSDPALIGGIELNGRRASLRNSLRQDLDGIVKELEFGDEHSR